MTKLAVVNVTKKIPKRLILGHQKLCKKREKLFSIPSHNKKGKKEEHTCERNPNVDKIVAAGTSNSTPYYTHNTPH